MSKIKAVMIKKIGDADMKNRFWAIYQACFSGSEKICAQNQYCYNEEDFKQTLDDEEFLKFYLETDGKIVAYTLATNNLDKARITYMNPEKFLAAFPEYAPNKIYYFTSIAILPEFRNGVLLYRLLAPVAQNINALGGIFSFDFSHETVADLPQIFVKITQILFSKKLLPYSLEYKKVGAQEYGVLVPKAQTPTGS